MKTSLYFLFIFLLVLSVSNTAQSITGLWEVTNVSVGSKQMTPIAKLMRINKDNTPRSGNGCLQNS